MAEETDWITAAALLLPFLAAVIAPVAVRLLREHAVWLLALAPASIFFRLAGFLDAIRSGGTVAGKIAWAPSLGLDFSWFFDGLSLTFGLLITGIGVLVVLYSGPYLKGHPGQGCFLSFMLLFMGSMLGLVSADSLLMLFVFWELTSITSFLLIGFDQHRETARRAALQALVVTGIGGLALLAGVAIIEGATGLTSLSTLIRSGDVLRESAFYLPALVLVLGAAFTKSAQAPFHVWLPNAMEAPTPVSAYLHSATMVKAGIYLLLRLNPVLSGTLIWEIVLPVVGGVTLSMGAVLALRQTDLKQVLAYTTIASLGLMVMLIGVGTAEALGAAVLYLIAHSLFKGALFMVAGTVGHETGTRDIGLLGGLRQAMPVTFAAGLIAALSMGGLPPLFGFLAKEGIYGALTGEGAWLPLLLVAAVLGNALMLAAGLGVGLLPFVGGARRELAETHEGPLLLWLGPLVLAVLGLAAALFAGPVNAFLSAPMASAAAGAPVAIETALLPHLGLPLALSIATIALGFVFLARLGRLRLAIDRTFDLSGWGPDRGFDAGLAGLIRLAAAVTRTVHNGRLDIYAGITFTIFAAALLVPMALFGEGPAWPAWPHLHIHEWAVLLLAAVGAIAAAASRDRLTAVLCLGIQGFAVALIYLLLGAPDLSFTQFMVETLSVVILALVLTRLRLHPVDRRTRTGRIRGLAVALGCGAGFGLLLLKVTQPAFDGRLSHFFETYSFALAHGRNIVNVIIVDFRGLDTLGEISVVMIAGLAILALIRIRPAATVQPMPISAAAA